MLAWISGLGVLLLLTTPQLGGRWPVVPHVGQGGILAVAPHLSGRLRVCRDAGGARGGVTPVASHAGRTIGRAHRRAKLAVRRLDLDRHIRRT